MRAAFSKLTFAALLVCVSAMGSFQVDAADDADAKAVSTSADSSVPAKTDSADEAFRKLDKGAKGYVTWEDIAALPDFATAFGNADSTHLGRLNLTSFTQAWTAYVQGKY
jgi:hypothetical protein